MRVFDTLREQWLICLVGIFFIGALVWRAYNPVIHDPAAEKMEQTQWKAEKLAKELEYEKKFYADEDKEIKEGKYPPTLIRVVAPNGGYVTGRWLFIPQCPKGFLCAQPDGTLEDESGVDWNAPPERYQQ